MIKYVTLNESYNLVDKLGIADAYHYVKTNIFDYAKEHFDMHIGLDIETTGLDPLTNKIIALVIGNDQHQVIFDCYMINPFSFMPSDWYEYTFIGHNVKFDASFIRTHFGIYIDNLYCTMVADQKLYQNSGFSFDLWSVVKRNLKITVQTTDEQLSFVNARPNSFYPSISQIHYMASDVMFLNELAVKQKQKLDFYRESNFVHNVEMPLINCLIDMELTGIAIDEMKWIDNTRATEYELYLKQIELDSQFKYLRNNHLEPIDRALLTGGIYSATRNYVMIPRTVDLFNGITYGKYVPSKGNINWNSTQQVVEIVAKLRQIMPTSCGMSLLPILDEFNNVEPKIGMATNGDVITHEGWTTDAKILERFIIEHSSAIHKNLFTLIIDHSKLLKELTTYGFSFLEKRDANTRRIHTIYRQTSTANGRLSSGGGNKLQSKPNLQNLPRSNKIRNCIIASPKHLLQTCDLSGKN
jgi:DNA polymerase I-like protein with 3'-5' exonuclease and polymerase domains